MPAATTFVLTLTNNFHRVPVKLAFTPDVGWAANTITVTGQYQVYGQWFEMPDFYLDDTGSNIYWSSIFGLEETWSVPVRVRFLRTQNSNGDILEDLTTTGTATTRTSPRSTDTEIRYIHPTGSDAATGLVYASPKKTLVSAVTAVNLSVSTNGGTIVFKNGTYSPADYDFTATGQWWVQGFNGTTSAYKTIRAETAGGATITGRRLMEIASGSWTRHAANIYYTSFADYMDTTNKRASKWLRKESDGSFLYLYRHLTTAGGHNNQWLDITSGTREGFLYDWTNNRIYVRTATDTAPATNAYSTGFDQNPVLWLSTSQQLIIEGLIFEMFGSVVQSGGNQYLSEVNAAVLSGGIQVDGCTNLVYRNCQFKQCVWGLSDPNNTNVTIEDSTFTGHNQWGQYVSDPLDDNIWDGIKDTPNEDFFVLSSASNGTANGFVIRRNAFSGGGNGVSLDVTTNGHNGCDVYKNSFSRMIDGCIEFNANNCLARNTALWHNSFSNCLNAIRVTGITNGPLWVIANAGLTDCGVFFGIFISGGAGNDAWKIVLNNTFITTTSYINPTGSAQCMSHGDGAGRIVAKNNIFQAPGYEYIYDLAGASYAAVNTYVTNAFYSTSGSATKWLYDGTEYATEALFLTAAGSNMSFSGNIYGTNPYPDGISGDIAPTLKRVATRLRGISVLAADANGNRIGEPGHLGYFPNFKHFLAPDAAHDQSVIEAPESVLGSQWRPHWRQSQLA